MNYTRADISFAVNRLCRYMTSPTVAVIQGFLRILQYLADNPDFGLGFRKDPNFSFHADNSSDISNASKNFITSFSDASWSVDSTDGLSTGGGLTYCLGTPIFWYSRKQLHVGRSSGHTELFAAAELGCEVLYQTEFFEDIGLYNPNPVVMNLDSTACIAMIKNPINHVDIMYWT